MVSSAYRIELKNISYSKEIFKNNMFFYSITFNDWWASFFSSIMDS